MSGSYLWFCLSWPLITILNKPSWYKLIYFLSCMNKLMENGSWNISLYYRDTKPCLYGFRVRRGTIDPIIVLGHEIGSILFGKKNNTFIVFFEHKAGFDFVDQIQLLKILAQLDIRGSLLTISSVFSPIGNVWYYWKTNIPDN